MTVRTSQKRLISGVAVAAVTTFLAGCAVGPNFHRPAAPAVTGYTVEALPDKVVAGDMPGGPAQQLAMGGDVTGRWWTLFGSAPLDALVEQALSANPDLAAAKAALRQSREKLYAGEGAFFPNVDGNFSSTRQKINATAFGGAALSPPPFTLHNASVSVTYALDVFGGTRRTVESLRAQAEAVRFQTEAAYLTLTANVVTAAIQEAAIKSAVAATQEIVAGDRQQLDIARRQESVGGISKAAFLAETAQVAAVEATLPPLEKQLAQQRNALAALAGRFPTEGPSASFDLAVLTMPETLPVSLPSRLVEQRPDIRAAEATLHAASAEIGVATANMLPQINLSGTYGSSTGQIGDLFAAGTGIWSLGAQAVQPIFHGGQLLHERRAAVAAYDQAAAQYRATVLAAFQNVADTLRALQSDADTLKAQSVAERAAADSLEIAKQQYAAGAISTLLLLDAQRTYQQARIALVTAQASRYADTVALFVALGGGWWNRPDDVTDHHGGSQQ
ncbi:MAG: efflux transporter outer membrane subunit [Rhodospirillaceae bacterium]|nr:MAG: efflux transporter outer membrane subunit [Rhodospirillaceae bacterium]